MANVTFKSNPATTVGELPAVGDKLPAFEVVKTDLSVLTSSDLEGKRVVLNIFPSLDTGVCADSVREFNKRAAGLDDNTVVVCVSKDLPFAQERFCAAEGIENVVTGSAFRTSFGEDFGVTLADSPMEGLLSRSVVVADADHNVVYTQLVDEITDSADFDAAIEALN